MGSVIGTSTSNDAIVAYKSYKGRHIVRVVGVSTKEEVLAKLKILNDLVEVLKIYYLRG